MKNKKLFKKIEFMEKFCHQILTKGTALISRMDKLTLAELIYLRRLHLIMRHFIGDFFLQIQHFAILQNIERYIEKKKEESKNQKVVQMKDFK